MDDRTTAYQRLVKFVGDKCDSSGEMAWAAKLVDAALAEEAQQCVNVVEELAIDTKSEARRDTLSTAAAAIWERRLKK
jgi:hypothetical protein